MPSNGGGLINGEDFLTILGHLIITLYGGRFLQYLVFTLSHRPLLAISCKSLRKLRGAR